MKLVSDWYDRVVSSQRRSKLILTTDVGKDAGSGKQVIRVAEETTLNHFLAAPEGDRT